MYAQTDDRAEWRYLLDERIGILMDSGLTEAEATLKARGQLRYLYAQALRSEGKDPAPMLAKWANT